MSCAAKRAEPTLHETLAAAGYAARPAAGSKSYAKEVFHIATGKVVADMRAEEAWAWLCGACAYCGCEHRCPPGSKCCPDCSHLEGR